MKSFLVTRPIKEQPRRLVQCCYCLCRFLTVLVPLLALAGGPVMAAQVSRLYEAEVPVEGQEIDQRNEAIIEAFRRVLVKVTGNRGIVHHPRMASDIPKAPSYVQQYRYRLAPAEVPRESAEDLPSESGEETIAPTEPAGPVRLLRVQFDEKALNRLLRQRGMPVWGNTRPAALVWLSVEQEGRRSLIAPESDGEILGGILSATEDRGIPMLFPLMDLEDQASLQVSDLWGGFGDSIRRASDRYGPDAIMTGRLVGFGPDLWRAGWTLYLGEEEFIWDSEGESVPMAVEAGVHSGMDVLASHFAPLAGDGTVIQLRMRVSGVKDIRGFARVKRYLMELGGVEQAKLISVDPDSINYLLRIRGDREALEQEIGLSSVLLPVRQSGSAAGMVLRPSSPSEEPLSSEVPIMYYRLQP